MRYSSIVKCRNMRRETLNLADSSHSTPFQPVSPAKSEKTYKSYWKIGFFCQNCFISRILFKMPNEVPEKACAILQLGGNSMLDISVTNLRKKPLKLYKNVEGDEWDEANEFPEKFPDLANRKYRLNKQQGLWFLMLDFSPAYGKVLWAKNSWKFPTNSGTKHQHLWLVAGENKNCKIQISFPIFFLLILIDW